MRAKFRVNNVEINESEPKSMKLFMNPVTDSPFDKDGNSDDNSFARWTPSGSLELLITNPNLIGQFTIGEKYYLDFTKVSE